MVKTTKIDTKLYYDEQCTFKVELFIKKVASQ